MIYTIRLSPLALTILKGGPKNPTSARFIRVVYWVIIERPDELWTAAIGISRSLARRRIWRCFFLSFSFFARVRNRVFCSLVRNEEDRLDYGTS